MADSEEATSAPDISTKLALERTRVAYERTMMAWTRTATSLITFGFTIYKFFQLEVPVPGAQRRLLGPREFALILVGMGLVSLALATLEFRQNLNTLGGTRGRMPLAGIVAAMVSGLGILAFVAMIFRQ